jgi:putative ABC transport system ATP-binding protein
MAITISVRHLDHYFGQGQLRKQVLFDINLNTVTTYQPQCRVMTI